MAEADNIKIVAHLVISKLLRPLEKEAKDLSGIEFYGGMTSKRINTVGDILLYVREQNWCVDLPYSQNKTLLVAQVLSSED